MDPADLASPASPGSAQLVDQARGNQARGDQARLDQTGVTQALPVKVIRSERRKKSSAARVVDGVLEIRIPAWMNQAQEDEAVQELVRKIDRKRSIDTTTIDLVQRARSLAIVYDLPVPREIKWVTNQSTRWGSCSYEDGVIRISSRLAQAPDWVVEYVILHELTHLVESGHTAIFHELMRRYPKAERAEGFLQAMSLGFAETH